MLDSFTSRFRQQRPRWFRLSSCQCSSESTSVATVVRKRPTVKSATLAAPSEGVSADSQSIIALMEKEGILHIASVGDCGLRIIHKGRVVFTTSIQHHYFDCPYQLSSELGGQTSADAMAYNLPMMEGDTIVMGSDGLFDNAYDRDIETIVRHFGGADKDSSQRTAKALATLASKHSKDAKYESPYCQEAISQGYGLPLWKKLFGKKLTGGKLDDITVIVGHVVDCQPLPIGAALTLCKENYGNRGS